MRKGILEKFQREDLIPERLGTTTALMEARAAVELIPDGAMVAICGAGGGMTEATSLIEALSARYVASGSPSKLTLVHTSELGDGGDRGISPLALSGLSSRVIGGNWGVAQASRDG
ncbi:CoA-transferase [Acidithrix ferrooxidans]|uniref:Acetate CoA-transferase YdiF n=1 Tax=Acidithrix ferrooxidans TaxID=1280514 RepID=A0A0D8HHI2_9ACTN|nr:CoA-transferase [Acidithrix ferrooxidans]KJF17440.1 acetate CoA-transferase YdiF [Acidithrix ferrooxidans]